MKKSIKKYQEEIRAHLYNQESEVLAPFIREELILQLGILLGYEKLMNLQPMDFGVIDEILNNLIEPNIVD
jgi:hypothetical protein